MKRIIIFLIISLALGFLSAEAPLYPLHSIAENFGADWCGACQFAITGLDALNAQLPNGELSIVRLLTESGPYSNPQVDARFNYYEVMGLPAVIFNGKSRIDGSGEGIADGSRYYETMLDYRFLGSPLRIKQPVFDISSGAVQVQYKLLDSQLNLPDADLILYLVENEVSQELDLIVRDVISQRVDLNSDDYVTTNHSFQIAPSYNVNNLWVLAFVQMSDGSIIQSASSRASAPYRVQAALSFDNELFGDANIQYESPVFYIYNMGLDDEYTRQIEVISAPEDWYFNYCDEQGNCYPGSFPIPLVLAAGEYAAYDLNLMIGSPGTAEFNFVISSDNLGQYKIPFRYTVGTSNSNLTAPAQLTLSSGYPNPFQNKVSFDLQSHKNGLDSELEIYNLKGQKLKSLPLHSISQGSHHLELDLGDLPNGIYFYKLQAQQQIGKLLKLK